MRSQAHRETTASEHVNTCECVYEQLRASETNFHFCFLFFFSLIMLFLTGRHLCSAFCELHLQALSRNLVNHLTLKILATLGARTPGRTTQNLSQKPIKQQLFAVHQIKSEVFQVRKNSIRHIQREFYSMIHYFCKSCLHWLCSPHGPNFTSSNLRHLRQRVYFQKSQSL